GAAPQATRLEGRSSAHDRAFWIALRDARYAGSSGRGLRGSPLMLGSCEFRQNAREARVSATASRPRRAADKDEAAGDGAPRSDPAAIDYGPLDRRIGYLLRRAQIAVFKDFFAAF